MAATCPTPAPSLSVAQPGMGPNHFVLCLQYLSLHLQPWVVPGAADLAGVADGPRKNNNAITVKMAGKGEPRRKEVPQPSPLAALERPNVRLPASGLGVDAQIW